MANRCAVCAHWDDLSVCVLHFQMVCLLSPTQSKNSSLGRSTIHQKQTVRALLSHSLKVSAISSTGWSVFSFLRIAEDQQTYLRKHGNATLASDRCHASSEARSGNDIVLKRQHRRRRPPSLAALRQIALQLMIYIGHGKMQSRKDCQVKHGICRHLSVDMRPRNFNMK